MKEPVVVRPGNFGSELHLTQLQVVKAEEKKSSAMLRITDF